MKVLQAAVILGISSSFSVLASSSTTSRGDDVSFNRRFLQQEGTTEEITTQVEQLGKSGKFRIFDGSKGNDENAVTVEVDAVMELAGDDSRIVGGHGTQTMANQEFSITDPVNTTLDGVDASMISFTSTLETKGGNPTQYGTIELDVFILQGNGTVGTETESWDIFPNDVKFNIVLKDWSFCDGCSYGGDNGGGKPDDTPGGGGGKPDDTLGGGGGGGGGGNPNARHLRQLQEVNSTHVDVSIIIKGKADEPSEDEDGDFDLGGGVEMKLSNVVSTDDVEDGMPEGYPQVKQNGGKTTYTFRFPRFEDTATYDPVVSYSAANGDSDNGGGVDDDDDGAKRSSLNAAGKLVLLLASLLF